MIASARSVLVAMLASTGASMAGRLIAPDPDSLAALDSPLAVSMEELQGMKISERQQDIADGVFDEGRYALQGATACSNGKAGEYSCRNVDLKGFLRHEDLGSRTREGNDVWGWTSSTGREFGIVGQSDGSAFVEILKDGSLVGMGRLPTQTRSSPWRDMKVIGNHVYIGSEAPDHGLQVFDLTKLLTVDPSRPPTFDVNRDLAAHFDGFGSSHNIVAHEKNNIIYAVGTARNGRCSAGLWMVDVSDPGNPRDVGCAGADGYVHDAQCLTYNGPDAAHRGKEICFGYNEDSLTIYDLSTRSAPRILSRTPYQGATYTHQGWTTGPDHRYLLLDDELDEQKQNGAAADGHTTTYIVDVANLSKPVFTGYYKSPVKSIDHNQYIVDGLSYMSNYASGLRVVNVTSVGRDNTGAGFKEVAFFDVRPEDDAVGGETVFKGAWSVYPYFQSGHVLVNSIERGIFSVKLTL
ncbi:regulatory P domain-containing protein [Metarhizium album ARSEF 1941]|uniref:Regulatory P domain-containing protein n=1 Tax=Metarhizium album (strain ARSEF 1941) TaxID=1081103 RepID=A0A0B2X9W6_METAS|nr:regulatory P domain-containing protein [Metarhizium album ARSEF 1941]KHO02116.1 regulatory P domain-containing protein [Metarhizium album ARSEF 1941]